METATIGKLNQNILLLRREIEELKLCFHEDFLPLSQEVKAEIAASRKRKKSELIRHSEVLKEFCR